MKRSPDTGVILNPQPSNDINDPLNWSKWKRILAFCTLMLYVLLTGWVMVGPGPAMVLLMDDFHTDLTQTSRGVITWCVLTLGLGVFFLQSTSLTKRIELFLGTDWNLLRPATCFCYCRFWVLGDNHLVRRCSVSEQSHWGACSLCFLHQCRRRVGSGHSCRSILPS